MQGNFISGFSVPCHIINFQVTSNTVKFKCKSWIDTMGQRGCKAAGSVITNAFANSLGDLLVYGNGVGLVINVFLLVISRYMGRFVFLSIQSSSYLENLKNSLQQDVKLVRSHPQSVLVE